MSSDITVILKQISAGQPELIDDLMPLVYDQLRQLAHGRLSNEYNSNTLATTGLVHEAYLKLVRNPDLVNWQDRRHFYAIASRAMRQVLVNRALARKAPKRNGGQQVESLGETELMSEERADELIALDEALQILRDDQPRIASVVDLRYFGGFAISECANILEVSVATVNRDWRLAKMWLFNWLQHDGE